MLFSFLSSLVVLLSLNTSLVAAAPKSRFFYQGHDLSSLSLLEQTGSIYKDTSKGNQTRPAEDILGKGGMNTVRLRLWVNPQDFQDQPTDFNLQYTINLAKRFQSKGYKIYLDYHFSDTWADPTKQYIPAAWPKTVSGLSKTIRSYVSSSLQSFHKAGVTLSIVSLGNEIRNGMLWPAGRVDPTIWSPSARTANFTDLAKIYKSARLGVNDAVSAGLKKPSVMIHIDNGWDIDLQSNWFSGLTGSGTVTTADWDVFGFSFYPFYGSEATYSNLQNSLDTLAYRYNKPLMVVETDWPVVCDGKYNPIPEFSEPYPVSVQGQDEWVSGTLNVVKNVVNGLGAGVFYWEPAWLNNTGLGSACEDAILFSQDFSNPKQTVGYSRQSVNMFR